MASGREVIKKAPAEGLIWAEKSSIQDFYPKYRIFQLGKKKPATWTGRKIYRYLMARRIFSATPCIFLNEVEQAATLTPNFNGTANIKSSWSF